MFYLWLRRQVRKVMAPIPLKVAEKYNDRFTFVYILCAWSMLGMVMYDVFLKKVDINARSGDARSSAKYYGRAFRAENMQVYDIRNGELMQKGAYKYEEDVMRDQANNEFYGPEKQD